MALNRPIGTSPGASPRAKRSLSDHSATDESGHGERAPYPQEDGDSRLETSFENRAGLDTLAAAALKPLATNSYGDRSSTSSSLTYQQPTQLEYPPRQDHDSAPAEDDPDSRFQYRNQSRQLSDEDSEEGGSHQLDRPRQENPQEAERSLSPYYASRSPQEAYDQDSTMKSNSRSTMSISSLLDYETRPQGRGSSQVDGDDLDSESHEYRHHLHHEGFRSHRGREDPSEGALTGPMQPFARSHLHHRNSAPHLHSRDMAHHHHHHHRAPHPHPHPHPHHHPHVAAFHQHGHGHVHHHRPQHIVHQHPHQHPPLPHHHHHHAHHHHLHQDGKSSMPSSPSAFSYLPKSLGLRLNPKLKVNATQVYISYLIQLDQMQRAQHLRRSSEKRKSIHDSTTGPVDVLQQHSHSRTFSSGEASRGAQIVPHQEDEVAQRESERASPTLEAPRVRDEHRLQKLDDADMLSNSGSLQLVTASESSGQTSLQMSRHNHTHVHHPHPYLHQQHSHQGPGHAHAHPHHSAPVLPAHIHPAQHHHHIVSSTAKSEQGVSKAGGSQSVHRHHASHHHHPHHHPYHPNHPNHQHHFHHHAHPAGHNHNHIPHAHGHPLMHGHNHAHHAHTHGYANDHPPSLQRPTPILELTHHERRHNRKSSQQPVPTLPLKVGSPLVISKEKITSDGGQRVAGSPTPPRQSGSLRPSPFPVSSDESRIVSKGSADTRDDSITAAGEDKSMELEHDDVREHWQTEDKASSLPQAAPPSPQVSLATTSMTAHSDNTMLVD